MDLERVKQLLSYLALGDHMGDVNNTLPALCKALGLAEPEWDDALEHFVFDWDEPYKDEDE